MSKALVIAEHELRRLFTTSTSYVVLGVFFLLSAIVFVNAVAAYQHAAMTFIDMNDMQQLRGLNLTEWVLQRQLYNAAIVLLFVLPLLTMSFIAGERRDKTLVLLLTMPIRIRDVVIGKYLALMVFLTLMVGLTLVFPVLLHVFGTTGTQFSAVDWSTIWVAYMGLLLMGAAFASVGLCASSFFNSQVAAAAVSYLLLAGTLGAGAASSAVDGWRADLLNYISCLSHLSNFLNGLVSVSAVTFFVSLVGAGLLMTAYSLEQQREA